MANSVSFSYTLPAAATTSAGVYKADGTLLRTLWNNEARPSGSNSATWDGLDDNGQTLPVDTYQVKVLSHNVSYTWEGYIGNTSTNQTGSDTFRAFCPISDMTITGSDIYTALAYNEGGGLWNRLSLSNTNAVASWGLIDFGRKFFHTVTDGSVVYMTSESTGFDPLYPSFVTAINAGSGTPYTFSAGANAPRTGTQGVLWNAIDYREGTTGFPSGIAVQKTGSYLFVAHRGLNLVNIFNKTTGAAVGSISVTEPGRMGATVDGHLWVICSESGSRVVRRYNINASGVASISTAVVTGLSDPLGLAVSPDNTTLSIVDGGTSQQVKAFANVASGSPAASWTLGLAGGYNAANGPDVSNTKFCFPAAGTFIAYQNDGSFWLGDSGNERYLHFSAARAYLGQLAYLSHNYVSTVCDATPTRLFANNWLEFAVDYSQPAKTGWSLVKNWSAGLGSNFTADVGGIGLRTVVKLSNNRTYGVACDDHASGRLKIMELPASGMLRDTGVIITGKSLLEDGSVRWQTLGTNTVVYSQQLISSFDGSGNPILGATTQVASAPKSAIDPAGNGFVGPAGRSFPVTTGSIMISASTGGALWTYHLGGIRTGGTDWLWKAAPEGLYFDGHGTVGDATYPANNQFVRGRNIIFCCHGEGYLGSQADQYLHYLENGLMIGEFGKDLTEAAPPPNTVLAKRSGNAISSSMTQVGSDYYVWANDEWGTGVHRWKISNASSITELTPINVTLSATGDSGEGLTGEYFTGTNFDTLSAIRNDQAVNFSWTSAPVAGLPADNFSVRWSGLVKPVYSENYTFYTQSDAGVRLWVNGVKIIDNWTAHSSVENTSTSVSLVAGQSYKIVMEYYDTAGTGVAQLKWSSSSQAKQLIPVRQLYPSDAQALHMGGAAIGRFLQDPLGTTGTNIVTTASAIDLSGVTDPAPAAAYQSQRKGAFAFAFSELKKFTNYKVRFHVAEIVASKFAVNARVFPVTFNKVGDITPGIDPFALAGAGYKAAVREVTATTDSSGVLDLKFSSNAATLLAGVEIERAADQSTPAFSLVGKGSGLKGIYYNGTNFNTQASTRFDPELNFTWGTGNPLPGVGPTNYTVRWTGRVLTKAAGDYSFGVTATAGKRLWVNGVLVLDYWGTAGTHYATVNLAASTLYDIKLEYLNTTGSSNVALKWKLPGGAVYGVIPQLQLYPPATTFETILDNSAASGVTLNGAWSTSSSAVGFYGANYLLDGNADKGSKSVVYAPALPSAGTYDVYMMFSAGSSRAASVPVTIAHTGGTSTVMVNQKIDNGKWVLLGTYNFNAGTTGTVTISNTGTSGFVVADAVRFVK